MRPCFRLSSLVPAGFVVDHLDVGIDRIEAARYVGISTTTFDKLVREGKMPEPFRIGARMIWDLRKLDLAFDVLSGPEEADSFAGWDDWDASSRGQSKAEQKEQLDKADAERIQARKDARRRSGRRQA